MNWDDLQKKHMQQHGDFIVERDKAWQAMTQQHDQIRAAFGDRESELPDSMRQKFDRDKKEWQAEWGNNGKRMTELKASQQNDINALAKTGDVQARQYQLQQQNREKAKDQEKHIGKAETSEKTADAKKQDKAAEKAAIKAKLQQATAQRTATREVNAAESQQNKNAEPKVLDPKQAEKEKIKARLEMAKQNFREPER